MAVSQNFLTGRMSGSAGGARFSTWKGKNVVATKPVSIRQNVTPAVQLNRDKMSVVGKAMSRILSGLYLAYNFGIQKTTEYADAVKFFRGKQLDTLKLDPLALAGSKFGTGNTASNDVFISDPTLNGVVVEWSAAGGNPLFAGNGSKIDMLFVNDSMTKIFYMQDAGLIDDEIATINLSDTFSVGDKIALAAKPHRFTPGNDLAGKVQFASATTFYTLTA